MIIVLVLIIFSSATGLFLLARPELTIEWQRRFYAKINWRMEPISMPKELRNTRLMGCFLTAISLVALVRTAIVYFPR